MAKQTWVNVNGAWKKVKSVWVNINGVWKKDVMPKGVVQGNWKEFMSYAFDYEQDFYATSTRGENIFLTKFNGLNVVWEKSVRSIRSGYYYYPVCSPDGLVAVMEKRENASAAPSVYSVYNSTGDSVATSNFEYRGDNRFECITDDGGSVRNYLITDNDRLFLERYDSSGTRVWRRYIDTPYNAESFLVTKDGVIFIANSSFSHAYDLNGNVLNSQLGVRGNLTQTNEEDGSVFYSTNYNTLAKLRRVNATKFQLISSSTQGDIGISHLCVNLDGVLHYTYGIRGLGGIVDHYLARHDSRRRDVNFNYADAIGFYGGMDCAPGKYNLYQDYFEQ